MKKSKRLLALLLSVMLIMGAVCSVPFTVSAGEFDLTQTGVNFLNLYEEKTLAETVKVDTEYIASVPNGTNEEKAVYATFKTAEAGYYEIWAKNENIPSDTGLTNVSVVDEADKDVFGIGIIKGEENSTTSRLEADTRYYVKIYSSDTSVNNGGIVSIKLSYFADAEPDEMTNTIIVKAGEAYEGSIDVAEDKDWIFVQVANDKKHSFTLENLNEDATAFKAEVYDTKNNLLDTVTTETENAVTVEFEKPSEVVSYYVCVTGANADVRGNYSIKMEEVAPKSVEIPLEEDYYDTIAGYGTEGGHDYLKFTTIDKDAYYTIYAKNIDINTHSWSKENGLQFVIFNAQSEEIDRIRLIPASEGSTTLKLQPSTTYYMQVYNHYLPDSKGGNYKINISYVLDPDKNEMENATERNLEEKYYGNIAARGDTDWFKITTNEETDYTFTLKNITIKTHSWSHDLRFRGVLYNDKHEELTKLSMFSGEEFSTRITLDPNTTYYIAIWDPEGTTGDYSFDLSVTVIIDEEAVGMANAVELKFDEEYYDSITNWDGDNKVDYLKFTTLNEPAYYTLTAKNINIPADSWTGDNQVQVKIWNEHKEEISKITLREGDEGSTTVLLDTNTTYYVRINHNQNAGGNYKVKVTYVLDPEPNVIENGKTIRIGERYYGNLATSGDKDYFKITTGEKTDYILYLKNINIPTHSWSGDYQFRVVLYNKYSEELGKVQATNGNEGNINITLEPNTTYYMGIWDPENTSGDYNVILSDGMLLGDVTLDNAVKIQDATLIQKSLAKLAELNEKQNAAADVTEDGKVNIKDATAIQKFLAKIETEYKTGQLVLSEIKYDEPATEPATEPAGNKPETETTTAAVDNSTAAAEPTEVVVTTAAPIQTEPEPTEEITATATVEPTEAATETTVATEVTEATEATEATETTEVTDPAETTEVTLPTEATTGEPEITTPVVPTETATTEVPQSSTVEPEETTTPEDVQKTYFEQLKDMVKACEDLSDENAEYADEAPLAKNSKELAQKAEFGFVVSQESTSLNEYIKFHRVYDIHSYNMFRGIEYDELKSLEALEELKPAYEWFKHYVTEVHPNPSGRVVYFENSVNWRGVYVTYWKTGEKTPDLFTAKKMAEFTYGPQEDMYYFEIPYGFDHIQFVDGNYRQISMEIDLTKCYSNAFRLSGGSMAVGSSYMVYYYDNFSYRPFDLPL